MQIFITYSNELRPSVTGAYTSMNLAHEEKEKRRDLDYRDTVELKGNFDKKWEDMNISCVHYNPHIDTIASLIECLYNLEGCICGGLAHVVVDDDNFDDSSIGFVLDLCEQEENQNKEEVGLVKLICNELKKLSMQERALLFSSYYSYRCDNNCEKCSINHGKMISRE